MRLVLLLLLASAAPPLPAGFLDPVTPPTTGGAPLDAVRGWVRARLAGELGPGTDFTRLTALAVPLARDQQRMPDPASESLLAKTAAFLGRTRVPQTECRKLWQVEDVAAALREAGVAVDTGDNRDKAARCDRTGSRFDMADALFQACHHGDGEHRERLPGVMEDLARAQRPDGQFVAEDGRPSFHLTARAITAMHACGGAQERVQAGQRVLAGMLSGQRHRGLNGRMVEGLVALSSTGAVTTGYGRHVDYLRQRIRPDGGLCPQQHPGCRSDWRATGLLLELLSAEQQSSGPKP